MLGLVFGIWLALTPAAQAVKLSPTANNDSATIVVYRLSDFQQFPYQFKANQKIITKQFRMYQYIQFKVPAGTVLFETSGNISVEKKRFSMQVIGGKIYYLEAVVDYSYMSNALLLIQREEEVASEVVRRLKQGGQK